MVDQAHALADHLASSQKSAEGMSSAFKGAFLALGGASLANKIIGEVVERSRLISGFNRVTSAESMNQNVLVQRYNSYFSQASEITKRIRTEKRGITLDEELQLKALRAQMTEYQRQRQFNEEWRKFGNIRLALLGSAVALTSQLFLKQRQFNQDLIEANSSWEHRGSLLRQTLLMQTQLGVGFEKATEAVKALVHYGMDTESSFEENVRLVAQMDQGLGIAVVQSAQLASIVERQLHGSFVKVSHVLAQIVEDTALAGDEAARLATSIATALGRLRPGLGAAGLPEVVRLVGRYEGALKEVGGQAGAFQELIGNLTTIRGMAGAGVLGVKPELVATEKGIQVILDRFSAFGQTMVGNLQGMARFQMLEQLGEMFGVSSDQANQMLIAIKRANQQQVGSITLQDRWRNQLHATDQGVHRLINSLTGLVQGALYWPLQAIGAIVNIAADMLESVLKYREIVYAATIAVGAGMVVLAWRAARLVVSLYSTMTAASAAALSLARLNTTLLATAATSAVGGAGGVAGGAVRAAGATAVAGGIPLAASLASIGRYLLLLVRAFAITPLGLLVTGLAVLGGYTLKVYSEIKRLREESNAAQKDIVDKEKLLKESREQKVYTLRRTGGSPEDMMHQYKMLVQELRAKAVSPEDFQAQLQEATKRFTLDIAKAGATDVMLTPQADRTERQRQQREEDRRLSEQLLKVNEDQKTLFDKTYKLEQEKLAQRELEQIKMRANEMRTLGWMR